MTDATRTETLRERLVPRLGFGVCGPSETEPRNGMRRARLAAVRR